MLLPELEPCHERKYLKYLRRDCVLWLHWGEIRVVPVAELFISAEGKAIYGDLHHTGIGGGGIHTSSGAVDLSSTSTPVSTIRTITMPQWVSSHDTAHPSYSISIQDHSHWLSISNVQSCASDSQHAASCYGTKPWLHTAQGGPNNREVLHGCYRNLTRSSSINSGECYYYRLWSNNTQAARNLATDPSPWLIVITAWSAVHTTYSDAVRTKVIKCDSQVSASDGDDCPSTGGPRSGWEVLNCVRRTLLSISDNLWPGALLRDWADRGSCAVPTLEIYGLSGPNAEGTSSSNSLTIVHNH